MEYFSGSEFDLFFTKKQIKFTPAKIFYLIYYLPDAKKWRNHQ